MTIMLNQRNNLCNGSENRTMEQKTRSGCRLTLSVVIIPLATCLATSAQAKDGEAMGQRVLRASHLSRINDVEMKPWHLKASFQLYDPNGKPSKPEPSRSFGEGSRCGN